MSTFPDLLGAARRASGAQSLLLEFYPTRLRRFWACGEPPPEQRQSMSGRREAARAVEWHVGHRYRPDEPDSASAGKVTRGVQWFAFSVYGKGSGSSRWSGAARRAVRLRHEDDSRSRTSRSAAAPSGTQIVALKDGARTRNRRRRSRREQLVGRVAGGGFRQRTAGDILDVRCRRLGGRWTASSPRSSRR